MDAGIHSGNRWVQLTDGHDHSHDYRGASKRALLVVLALVACHMTVEIVGGILSGSLGLLAHAAHMVTDAVALGLALFAIWISERPASINRTFGFHRAEVLAVLFNALALVVLSSWIFYEAYTTVVEHAEGHHHEVEGATMLIVSAIGLVINSASAWILYRCSRDSLNVEGAFWHIIADLMGSIAVVASGVLVFMFDWDLLDPVLGVIIATLILATAVRLAIKVFRVLLESTPPHLDMYELCSVMEDEEGVMLVHDVHAWTITKGYDALTLHVLLDPNHVNDPYPVVSKLREVAYNRFGIHHVTIQVERSAADCAENHHVGHLQARSRAGI